MEKAKECLNYLAEMLTENHGAIEIEGRTDEMGVLLTLKVAKEDMGRIVGREGAIAKAIRTILRTVGAMEGARINLKILEPEGSTRNANN